MSYSYKIIKNAMRTKVILSLTILFFFQCGVSFGHNYNLMVANNVLRKYNTTADQISKPGFQVHQYQQNGKSDKHTSKGVLLAWDGDIAGGIIFTVLGITYAGIITTDVSGGLPKKTTLGDFWRGRYDGFAFEQTGEGPLRRILFLKGPQIKKETDAIMFNGKNPHIIFRDNILLSGAFIILSLSVLAAGDIEEGEDVYHNRYDNQASILLQNSYPYPLQYDTKKSGCDSRSGQVKGYDIYPAACALDTNTNSATSHSAALNAGTSKITSVNTGDNITIGKIKTNGALSHAFKKDIAKSAYSIGAVMQAGKNGINCTLVYSAEPNPAGDNYSDELKILVIQSPSRLGRAGQLQVHILPQGDLNGKQTLIQQPQVEPQTTQMLENVIYPLKTAVNPFAKQKQDNNGDNQNKSKAGVAIINLSPNAD